MVGLDAHRPRDLGQLGRGTDVLPIHDQPVGGPLSSEPSALVGFRCRESHLHDPGLIHSRDADVLEDRAVQ